MQICPSRTGDFWLCIIMILRMVPARCSFFLFTVIRGVFSVIIFFEEPKGISKNLDAICVHDVARCIRNVFMSGLRGFPKPP